MDTDSATPKDASLTDTGPTFASKTSSIAPTRIQHQKSAILTIEHPKKEYNIGLAIYNQMKIKPHSIIQINNTAPYDYQITFENEHQYLQALPQKLQNNNQTYLLKPLAHARIQISIMRVDAELDDKDVDLAFVKYGKIITKSKKLYRTVEGLGQLHVGNRHLTLELGSPDTLPPNSIYLSPGIQSQVIYTVPGTNKSNQTIAYEARQEKRRVDAELKEQQLRAEEQEEERRIINEEHSAPPIARELQEVPAAITRTENSNSLAEDHPADTINGTDNSNSPPTEPLDSTQDVINFISPNSNNIPVSTAQHAPREEDPDILHSAQINIDVCDKCGLDKTPAVIHVECDEGEPEEDEPCTVDELQPDRNCSHGATYLREGLHRYKNTRDAQKTSRSVVYVLAKSHETYFEAIIHKLGLETHLSPTSIARVVLFAASEQLSDKPEQCKVNQEVISSVQHHSAIHRAINELNLLPNRGVKTINFTPKIQLVTAILDGCLAAMK